MTETAAERRNRIRRELVAFAVPRHIALDPEDIKFSEGFPLIDGMPAEQWLEAMTEERPEITNSQPKYPDCTVQLSGTDANAVAIFRTVRKVLITYLRAQGWDYQDAVQEGDAFQTEATSGDYDHVLTTCHRWVTVT